MKPNINSRTIVEALRVKHKDDIGFTEMQFDSGRRVDYWAMPRSWSPIRTYGYEIKVNRRDFLGDEKWPDYLKAVHYLYFACPWGLIKPDELPPGVGLLYLGKNGTRLTTKKKPVRNEVADHQIMTCAVRGLWRNSPLEPKLDRTQRIAAFKQQVENANTGEQIAKLLSWKHSQRLFELERQAKQNEKERERLTMAVEFCAKHKIPLDSEYRFSSKLKEYERSFADELTHGERTRLGKIKSACETLLELSE